LIEAKTKGGPPRKTKAPETGGNVVDLMEALRRSLAKDKTPAPANNARAGKKTAKADKRQSSLLLPIKGSEKEKAPAASRSGSASPRTATRRKRA
jgi:DNA end-binding protein Ku